MNLMLFALDEYMFKAFREAGMTPRVWVRTGRQPGATHIGKTVVYDHSPLKYGEVDPVFARDFPADLHQRVWQQAFPYFIRNINRTERSPRDRFRSWADYHHQFHIMLHWYYHLLRTHDIDTIVFDNTPHGGTTMGLFFLAREMGVRTIIGYQTLFTNRFFLMEDFRDLGLYETSARTGVKTLIELRGQPETPYYMKDRDTPASVRRRMATVQLARLFNPIRKWLTGIDKSRQKRREFHTLRQRLQMMRLQEGVPDKVDLSRPYVYFPLHFQPELTIDVFGDEFADQLSAVEALRRMLPDEVHIYVKENPKQTMYAREANFFKRLSAIPNTTYVNFEVDTYDLIRNSIAVATVVGTAGWEALQMGKPVITFGYAWYRCLPGVFDWRKGVSWNDVLGYRHDRQRLEEAVADMADHFYEGCIMPKGYAAQVPGFDPVENGRLVQQAVAHHLENAPARRNVAHATPCGITRIGA